MWWCWGDLEGELKGRKLHSFSEGLCLAGNEKKPSEEEIDKEGWVTGEDISQLKFKLEEGGESCEVEVVK
ncbi:hypothetical protein K505DRAFT_322182 [Melanomma pulvis-pyrius CBS 109.77]|uniref:Uncharacterized protein n=1 Tax=Melanomma pulvis-pyrius CBS 109.77 TaxID=1314802 RepID=A0A6A6XNL5_9PLEO|nr:hypothetical protein K505DRAFT_322182 [Melanomma pulvis-pyrius CBS 109.77]